MFEGKVLFLCMTFQLFLQSNVLAGDLNVDILEKFESNINKIEDIQCTVKATQTGSTNPVYFEKRIKIIQTLEELGEISKSEMEALIEPIQKERDENEESKDFVYEHPVAKWKIQNKDELYNVIIYDGNNPSIGNYDGNQKISFDPDLMRGSIDNQMLIPDIPPDFMLLINNKMPVVKFFKTASENKTLKISQKNGLIEMEGVLPGEMNLSFGNLPTYYKFTVDPARMYMPTSI
ncbi:MAG: hypothetical protein P8016_03840, partial [Sedimentisphaerales bacterium]